MNDKHIYDDTKYLTIPKDIQNPIDRMFRITGFVTVLCPPLDERPLAFARFYHVRRVAWTAGFILKSRIANDEGIDIDKLFWLAWAHDLNRWPFAHNSEKSLFDQAEDVPRYFDENKIFVKPGLINDLKGIINKDHVGLSKEARIVLLADIITGFIEDPIWATTALDLLPSFIPDQVNNYLCLNVERLEFQRRLLELNNLFYKTRSVEPFESKFDLIFKEIATRYILTRNIANSLPLEETEFQHWRQIIKENFMRNELFLYNNEKISHGSLLFNEIILPLSKKLGSSMSSILTSIDEPQLVKMALELKIISDEDNTKYLPTLDFVEKYEPQNSFRKNSLYLTY
jgi:hypothetical protein